MDWQGILIPIIAGVGGYVLRRVLGDRIWNKIRGTAQDILQGGDTTDPKRAVTEALIKHNLDRIAEEAKKVEAAFKPLEEAKQLPLPIKAEKVTELPRRPWDPPNK